MIASPAARNGSPPCGWCFAWHITSCSTGPARKKAAATAARVAAIRSHLPAEMPMPSAFVAGGFFMPGFPAGGKTGLYAVFGCLTYAALRAHGTARQAGRDSHMFDQDAPSSALPGAFSYHKPCLAKFGCPRIIGRLQKQFDPMTPSCIMLKYI